MTDGLHMMYARNVVHIFIKHETMKKETIETVIRISSMIDNLKEDVERMKETRRLLFDDKGFGDRERVDFAVSRMAIDSTFAVIFMRCVKEAIDKTIVEKSLKTADLERQLNEL